jgi:hypothetical protein
MPENPPLTEIVWQCEGHTREKNIRINAKYFPNRHEDAAYPFYLFVNGQHLETCSGAYVPKEKSIIVGIGSVKKSDCIKRDCMLKASFDIRKKIPLPEPTVLLVNGSKVREVSFS